MTSLWSNCELLYSMPVVGATKSSTGQSCISGNAAGNPAYLMPPLATLWSQSAMLGKAINIQASGTYDAASNYNVTTQLAYDGTQGSYSTPIAATGIAVSWPTGTTNNWYMNVNMTCISVGLNTSGWTVNGNVMAGAGNNAATAAATTFMMGGAQTAGVPTALALVTTTTIGFIELWSTWSTAPTAMVCSQFMIFAEN